MAPTTAFEVMLPDEAATCALAFALAKVCVSGDCLLLRGDLGSGKTTFARGFIHALQAEPEEVVSPTFTLAQTYPTRAGTTIWHFDFYRLRSRQEIAELGLDEALQDGITLIEWPEIMEGSLPTEALDVRLRIGNNPSERLVVVTGSGKSWPQRLKALKEKYG